MEKFNKLAYTRRPQIVWADFVTVCACAISNTTDSKNYEVREKRYMDTIKNYSHDEITVFAELLAITTAALEDEPEQDFLGTLFEQRLNMGNFRNGQFFTPYPIAKFMASTQIADAPEIVKTQGYVDVNDPTCGAGVLLIAYANALKEKGISCSDEAFFVAQDIDSVLAMTCYIQLSLLGCSGYVAAGNSLTDPKPSDENLWHMPMSFRFAFKRKNREETTGSEEEYENV